MRPSAQQIADTLDKVDRDLSYSLSLERLVDGVHTYVVRLGGETFTFEDAEDGDTALDLAYAFIADRKLFLRAEAMLTLFGPAQ